MSTFWKGFKSVLMMNTTTGLFSGMNLFFAGEVAAGGYYGWAAFGLICGALGLIAGYWEELRRG